MSCEQSSIYVVTRGDYSDYSIVGVFSTGEFADEFVNKFGGDVEEFPINPAIEQLNQGLERYLVRMDIDGNTDRVSKLRTYCPEPLHSNINYDCILIVECWAKDEKHAIKITNEKRTQLIVNSDWKHRVERKNKVIEEEKIKEMKTEDMHNELFSTLKGCLDDDEDD